MQYLPVAYRPCTLGPLLNPPVSPYTPSGPSLCSSHSSLLSHLDPDKFFRTSEPLHLLST